MLDRSQMGLIFDLDETLLVAHSGNTVEGRMESCRRARSVLGYGSHNVSPGSACELF